MPTEPAITFESFTVNDLEYRWTLALSHAAIIARDAIDSCFCPEWRAAHDIAHNHGLHSIKLRDQLALNRATRYGAWRTDGDKEMMMRGYLF